MYFHRKPTAGPEPVDMVLKDVDEEDNEKPEIGLYLIRSDKEYGRTPQLKAKKIGCRR